MNATLVHEFLSSLEDRAGDRRTLERVRVCLEMLGRPDVRYLVATIRGNGSTTVARYARGVLQAAGAPTADLTDPLADVDLERAGTQVASAVYQLGIVRPELGELSRREAGTLIALTAAAEASFRVMLLVDEDADPQAPLLAVAGDLVVLVRMDVERIGAAIAEVPDRRPLLVGRVGDAAAARAEEAALARELPLVLGGRDFEVQIGAAGMDLRVAGERYPALAIGPGDDPELAATGIVAALGIGTLGVRMRPDWVELGARAAAGRQ